MALVKCQRHVHAGFNNKLSLPKSDFWKSPPSETGKNSIFLPTPAIDFPTLQTTGIYDFMPLTASV